MAKRHNIPDLDGGPQVSVSPQNGQFVHRFQKEDRQVRAGPEAVQYSTNALGQHRQIRSRRGDFEKACRHRREEAAAGGKRQREGRVAADRNEKAQNQHSEPARGAEEADSGMPDAKTIVISILMQGGNLRN